MRTRNNGRYNGNGRDWETPPEVFGPLHAEFAFTLDPCATAKTAKCPRFFTEAEDGLARSWVGERVFVNPPYGREVYAWTRKARIEAAQGVLVVGLLPASSGCCPRRRTSPGGTRTSSAQTRITRSPRSATSAGASGS